MRVGREAATSGSGEVDDPGDRAVQLCEGFFGFKERLEQESRNLEGRATRRRGEAAGAKSRGNSPRAASGPLAVAVETQVPAGPPSARGRPLRGLSRGSTGAALHPAPPPRPPRATVRDPERPGGAPCFREPEPASAGSRDRRKPGRWERLPLNQTAAAAAPLSPGSRRHCSDASLRGPQDSGSRAAVPEAPGNIRPLG